MGNDGLLHFWFLFILKSITWVTISSLAFSYGIEFSQLYQVDWINRIRRTMLGGLVLGEVFLWSDMLCYTIGTSVALLIEHHTIQKSTKSTQSKQISGLK